jgi:spore germination cell wall hydrolase CwlJ-like protein
MKKTLITALILSGFFFASCISIEQNETIDPSKLQFVERNYKVVKDKKEEACLAEALYYEAGNQSELGKEAVAVVIMNRVGAKGRPKTICGVVKQAHIVKEVKVCQFTFFCKMELKRPGAQAWKDSKEIAHRVLQSYWKRDIMLKYSKATYYHAEYVNPKWSHTKKFVGKIDKHLFYEEKS